MTTGNSLRIGLALSGGGFRATMFHLGVVRLLADANLLCDLSHVCSVSGGSILAAHLALKWPSYSKGAFDDAANDLIRFIENGLRERVTVRWPFVWCLSLFPKLKRFNATWLLKRQYRAIYHSAGFEAVVPDKPEFHILATDLTKPSTAFCFHKGRCERHPSSKNPKTFSPSSFELAGAVAASSAFPGLFPPLMITNEDFGATEADFDGTTKYLSDGGTFDNLGAQALRDLELRDDGLDLLIFSDASKKNDDKTNTPFLREWRYLPRLFDIMGQQINDLQVNKADPREIFLSIHTVTSSKSLDREIQEQMGTVRTDLDSFSKLLVRSLVCHGYGVARETLIERISRLIEENGTQKQQWSDIVTRLNDCKGWEPYKKATFSGDTQADIRAIQADRKRRIKPGVLLKDWTALIAWLVVLLSLGLGTYLLGAKIAAYVRHSQLPVTKIEFVELQNVVMYYWDKNQLAAFARDYENRQLEITGNAVKEDDSVIMRYVNKDKGIREFVVQFDDLGEATNQLSDRSTVTLKATIKEISIPGPNEPSRFVRIRCQASSIKRS